MVVCSKKFICVSPELITTTSKASRHRINGCTVPWSPYRRIYGNDEGTTQYAYLCRHRSLVIVKVALNKDKRARDGYYATRPSGAY